MTIERNALIGERVRFYRTTRDISLETVCDTIDMDITFQQLSRYETNKSRWPADLLCEVAEALDVDVRILCGLEEKKRKDTTDKEEWEAEYHKVLILELPAKARSVVYSIIQGMLDFIGGNNGRKQ